MLGQWRNTMWLG